MFAKSKTFSPGRYLEVPASCRRYPRSTSVPAKRWALLLLSIPIAIAANAFRVSGTGFLAHIWGLEVAQGFYHTFAGWLVFVVAFALLLACGSVLARFPDRLWDKTEKEAAE